MHCPFCNADDTKVIDSRLVADGAQVRRRRECQACNERFTTYETAELVMPRIVKRDGTRVPFDEGKLRASMGFAIRKRPISAEQVEGLIEDLAEQAIEIGLQADRACELVGDAQLLVVSA